MGLDQVRVQLGWVDEPELAIIIDDSSQGYVTFDFDNLHESLSFLARVLWIFIGLLLVDVSEQYTHSTREANGSFLWGYNNNLLARWM